MYVVTDHLQIIFHLYLILTRNFSDCSCAGPSLRMGLLGPGQGPQVPGGPD